MTAITIRPEAPGDQGAIHEVTEQAFRPMPFSDGSEPRIIDQLRDDGDLTLSLVAEDTMQIVGHIAFSPVTITDAATGWYGLGPVAVRPELQRQDIGGRLIRRGIADMRERGASGIILIGSTDYYPHFGFKHEPQLTYAGGPAEYFQCLLLEGKLPKGEVKYAPAFG